MINIHIPEPEYPTIEEKKKFLEQEAERMRNNPTEGEALFKQFCDKHNIHYHHQVPVIVGYKGFILDFVITTTKNPRYKKSKKRKIAIEIDGEYHNTKEQREKDAARTKTLKSAAYNVLRLTNEEVKNEDNIIKKLYEFLPTIKETELLFLITLIKSYQQVKEKKYRKDIVEINLKARVSCYHQEVETLTKLLVEKDKEIMYWKDEYVKLYKQYKRFTDDLPF